MSVGWVHKCWAYPDEAWRIGFKITIGRDLAQHPPDGVPIFFTDAIFRMPRGLQAADCSWRLRTALACNCRMAGRKRPSILRHLNCFSPGA